MQISRLIFVVFLPEEFNKLINPIRERFEPGVSEVVPPHISLTFPFWLKNGITEDVLNINFNWLGFQAKITNFGKFNNKVLYLKVEPQEKFQNLNTQLENLLKENIEYDTSIFPDGKIPKFIPHITLAMNTKETNLPELNQLLGQEFSVNNYYLLSNENKNEKWEIIKIFPSLRTQP